MSDQYSSEPMIDMFVFETTQLLEQLETCILDTEKTNSYTQNSINEIFRIMHTIKGSSAMMRYDNISILAHSMEDLFYFLREESSVEVNCSALSDLVLEGVDFIKAQIEKIKDGGTAKDDASKLITGNRDFLSKLKKSVSPEKAEKSKLNTVSDVQHYRSYANSFKAVVYFAEGCEMENIRAFNVIHNLADVAGEIRHIPEDIMESAASETIKRDGFTIYMKTDCSYVDIHQLLMQTVFLQELELEQISNEETQQSMLEDKSLAHKEQSGILNSSTQQQSIISVTVSKLDKLMDLMGEFVIAEAMVTQNTDLKGLELDNFQKSARQLNKITGELQDVVMSIRMVPLSATFQKMNRIVRDMCKKLDKEVNLEIIGGETEVDKNIIEHISDPLMHLVRNSIDHGIESHADRISKSKPKIGTITIEAKNSGSDVLIIVKDDGKGLNRDKILMKARENGLILKPEKDMTDKEIYNLILLPGFSTKEDVTEFSGRGVGMDVVTKNIETIGGSVLVDSIEDKGTITTLKIPLTLAIIDGMNIKVGNSRYTLPTISVKEFFRPKGSDIITDHDGNEMIMVRGQCYPILRLHEIYNVKTDVTDFNSGIMIMVEQDEKALCVFADELLGQQQVVIKTLPSYIKKFKKVKGLAGCTLLGGGSISLILDIAGLAGS